MLTIDHMGKLTRMKVFVKVVETGSFTAASERMGLSRAAISKYVSQLETSIGGRLLNRTTRHVSTTESGRIYFERCKDILHSLEEADDMVSGLREQPRGTLRISAPSIFAERHLIPLVSQFSKIYPAVNIDMMVSDREVDLVDEGYDLAIRMTNMESSDLIARRLACCRHVLIASADYLKTAPVLKEPNDLLQHSCLIYTYTQGAIWPLSKDGKDYSIKVKGRLNSNNPDVLLTAAIAGMGVTIMPTFIASEPIRKGDLKIVLEDYEPLKLQIYAIYPSRHFLPSKTRIFVDFLKKHITDPPYWDYLLDV